MHICTHLSHSHRCSSILVRTGVYRSDESNEIEEDEKVQVDHGHRDLPYTPEMTRPDYIEDDVYCAIERIFKVENWPGSNTLLLKKPSI